MTSVTVTRTSSNEKRFSASIDNVRLKFVGDTATKDVPPGIHILAWTQRGVGETFTIKITMPSATGCSGKSTGTTLPITSGACEFRTTV
jgi:hypothetical protein